MSDRPDPMRISDIRDPSEEELMLQSGVRMLRQQRGTSAEIESLAARLGPQLTTPVVAGSALLAGALLRFMLAGASVVGLGVGAWWLWGSGPHDVAAPATPAAIEQPAPVSVERAAPVGPALEAPVQEPAQAAPIERSGKAPARAALRPRTDKPKPAPVDPEAELALLGRAQALLDRDPNGALTVLGEHARSYGNGVFSEEREVLALEAENKLGLKSLARTRAERFIARFPKSAHARRVRTLLEPAP